jgi:hypothetical protein
LFHDNPERESADTALAAQPKRPNFDLHGLSVEGGVRWFYRTVTCREQHRAPERQRMSWPGWSDVLKNPLDTEFLGNNQKS